MPAHWDPVSEKFFRGARAIAESLEHTWIGTEHLALSMLTTPASLLSRKLRTLGREPAELGERLHTALDGTAGLAPPVDSGVVLSTRVRHIVAVADGLATDDGCEAIEERHLLQGLIEGGPGVFIRALLGLGVEPGALWRASYQEVASLTETVASEGAPAPVRHSETPPTVATPRSTPPLRPGALPAPLLPPAAPRGTVSVPMGQNPALLDFGIVTAPPAASRTPMLDRLGTEIKLPSSLVDRPALVEDLVVALCLGRGAPVLVGGSGCGKTAVLGLLAGRLRRGDVPPELQGLRILEIPAVQMLSPGFDTILAEAAEQPVLLVFDELHRPLAQDPAAGYAVLKRLLDAPPARMVGTSTPEGFRKHLAADAGLKRRLRMVEVPPTSQAETRAILEARRAGLESHYAVRIEPGALEAIWEGYGKPGAGPMPAVALDTLEEACVRARAGGQHPVTRALIESLRTRRPS